MRKKNCLVLFGSPHKNGFTARVLEKIIGKSKNKVNFLSINAYEQKIHPCIDCKSCNEEITCRYDDFIILKDLLEKSDLIIIASPIYNMGFPSPLKSILDRMQPYFMSKFIRKENVLKKKKAILILTFGSKFNITLDIKRQLEIIFASINTTIIGQIFLENTDKHKVIDKNIEKKIENLAKNFFTV
ncbi:MAG: flavodoxin family protein [Oscillospiraceae bacterium]|jgi:multimeric flavodoxin WrbA|nr:flavodoxin family protein [Oscillospiraceae bacterium]